MEVMRGYDFLYVTCDVNRYVEGIITQPAFQFMPDATTVMLHFLLWQIMQ
jgi:hypothetical protein